MICALVSGILTDGGCLLAGFPRRLPVAVEKEGHWVILSGGESIDG